MGGCFLFSVIVDVLELSKARLYESLQNKQHLLPLMQCICHCDIVAMLIRLECI